MRLFVSKRAVAVLAPLCLLVLLSLLASWQSRRLAERRRADLPEAYAGYTSDVPPALTFVIAGLGGFRGIVSEVLWFRADRLQEEGRYLELVQLSEWITMLDPHASEAWTYNAWNLAYNISIMMIRPEDRLRWVQNGIALLRDEGLRFNPREARLYRELAWLYQNKIGDTLDSAHLTYKFALAQAIAPCLRADGTVNDTPENRAALSAMRLDAARMTALEKRFGPLDWRLAETHAIYWASQGVAFATGAERLLCRRAFYQPLILCVLHGRFTGSLEKRQWQTGTNLALALPAADYMSDTLKLFPSQTLTSVYIKYLTKVVCLCDRAKENDRVNALHTRLRAVLPPNVTAPSVDDIIKGWELTDE